MTRGGEDGLRGGQATGGRRLTPRGLRTRARLVAAARQVFEQIPFRQARLTDITAVGRRRRGHVLHLLRLEGGDLPRGRRRGPSRAVPRRPPRSGEHRGRCGPGHRPRQPPVLPRLPPQRRRRAIDGAARGQRRGDRQVPARHREGRGQAGRTVDPPAPGARHLRPRARPADDGDRAAHDERPGRLRPPAAVGRSRPMSSRSSPPSPACGRAPSGSSSRHARSAPAPTPSTSLLGRWLARPPLDLLDDRRVGERRRVTEVAAVGDVAQQPAHDLAAARLGQIRREVDRLRLGERPDLGGHMIAQLVDGRPRPRRG